jgi:hypothetical protein
MPASSTLENVKRVYRVLIRSVLLSEGEPGYWLVEVPEVGGFTQIPAAPSNTSTPQSEFEAAAREVIANEAGVDTADFDVEMIHHGARVWDEPEQSRLDELKSLVKTLPVGELELGVNAALARRNAAIAAERNEDANFAQEELAIYRDELHLRRLAD